MIDHTFAVKKMKNLEELFVPFSEPTHMPFVECDEETYDDQVHVFANEAGVLEFVKTYAEKKIFLRGIRVPKNQMKGLYSGFYSIGANVVVFHENENMYHLDIKDVAELPDMEKMPKDKLPVMNQTLQLSTLYFLQEMYRPVKHDMQHAKELEEEMLVNLLRSSYILPLESAVPGQALNPKNPTQKKRIPYVKDKDDNLWLPVFSDLAEYQKFYKEKIIKMGMGVLTFRELPKHLAGQAKGLVVNPAGFHLHIPKEQLEKLVTVKE